jgi:gliding motility-associated-like protein
VTLAQPEPLVLNPSFINPGCEGFDTGIISAESVTGGVPPYQYSLSGGNFTSAGIYPGLTGGPWSLTVMDSNHCTDDTLAVLVAAEIPVAEAGEDVNLPLGCPHQLQAFSTVTPAIISWTNSGSLSCSDCLNPVAMPFNTTEYTLEVTSGDGCVARDSLTVRVIKDRNIYAPNVFSPNNDGLNDYFNLYTDKGARQIRYLGIYSRWGELVFEKFNFQPNELSEGWDGLFEGRVMPPGVFVWTAEVEYLDDEVVRIQGDVTIVR